MNIEKMLDELQETIIDTMEIVANEFKRKGEDGTLFDALGTTSYDDKVLVYTTDPDAPERYIYTFTIKEGTDTKDKKSQPSVIVDFYCETIFVGSFNECLESLHDWFRDDYSADLDARIDLDGLI